MSEVSYEDNYQQEELQNFNRNFETIQRNLKQYTNTIGGKMSDLEQFKKKGVKGINEQIAKTKTTFLNLGKNIEQLNENTKKMNEKVNLLLNLA